MLALYSGRTHQIRLHLAGAGLPIIGDKLYGLKVAQASRHALHASAVTFRHPADGREITIEAPVPPDMQQLLAKCHLGMHAM